MSLEHLQAVLDTPHLAITRKPVFIIGCPRSGTTALALGPAEHSQLWTSHESYFLHGLFGQGRARAVHTHQRNRSAPGWLKTQDVNRDEFLGLLGLGVNALYTSRSGGRRWVEQTPLYTLMADDLTEIFPDALFLHIVRDGRRVVHSMSNFLRKFEHRPEAVRHVPGWATDFREACRTWQRWVSTATSVCAGVPDRALRVVNEDLAGDPREGFRQILAFLEVEQDPGPADRFASTVENSSFGDVPRWPASDEPWRAWTGEQRRTFIEEAAASMADEGFATSEELRAWSSAPAETARSGPRGMRS